ncbi:hypothetical protein CPter91_2613 [Collimonas pratensis]|uniref:Uncharacterized protein n=1 Tax=Collimonas pratensis TaxID=279113 RepID=A0A127Q580_9BURK|nr:hypothetical protein CPter91_2613 [Collimonas pratensis]
MGRRNSVFSHASGCFLQAYDFNQDFSIPAVWPQRLIGRPRQENSSYPIFFISKFNL